MWMVHYQATNAGVVADVHRTWLKLTAEQCPTHEQIDAALALELEEWFLLLLLQFCFLL
jgi:hypothetical protein